tara:strand:- start:72 stop:575 length:504 start_codon:yes stop_codon:yes gene_type:complete
MGNYQFKTTNIKGKQYVEVNERIKYFRTEPKYDGWALETQIISLDENSCVVRATITNSTGTTVASGFAQEDRTSSMVNKTSYVENAETSAWGRCLANLGIGIDTSIASAQEVEVAIGRQNITDAKQFLTPEVMEKMKVALAEGKEDKVREALKKYEFNKEQLSEIGL